MNRRDLMTLIGGAAMCSVAARAQQPAMPVIGYIYSGTSEGNADAAAAFRKGLGGAGYVDGRDVAIEYRWADNQFDRLPAFAADLVRRRVALIVATPVSSALAAQAAMKTIPIVFQIGVDPVKVGLVSSFNLPGGNLTGVSQLSASLVGKRLELLHNLLPNASVVGLLVSQQSLTAEEQIDSLQQAAHALGLHPIILNGGEIDSVFEDIARQRIDALFVTASAYFFSVRDQLALLAARHHVPVIYESREFTEAGGLVSYGVDFLDVYWRLGVYAARILKGEKPADLPVLQPTKFELVINLKTAKALNLTIPPGVLAIADEVIE